MALDFGGTKHTAGVIGRGERDWRKKRRVFSPAGADAAYDLETMISLGRELLDGARPTAIGVSFGGPVDFAAGRVRLSHHVPGWEDTPLKEILQEAFGAPAVVDNDANAAALGEARFGAGRGCDHLLYVTVSSGVGGGWLLNGRIWRGVESMAGEIGHTVVDASGPRCLCGKRGCVERLASGPYLAQDYLAESGSAEPAMSGKRVAELAAQGDPLAQRLVRRSGWAVGAALGNAANLINPRLFILGGGVTKAGPIWRQAVHQAARETALPEIHYQILPAALGDDAPLWGAAALAIGVSFPLRRSGNN